MLMLNYQLYLVYKCLEEIKNDFADYCEGFPNFLQVDEFALHCRKSFSLLLLSFWCYELFVV
jgi:hypothetical protein